MLHRVQRQVQPRSVGLVERRHECPDHFGGRNVRPAGNLLTRSIAEALIPASLSCTLVRWRAVRVVSAQCRETPERFGGAER